MGRIYLEDFQRAGATVTLRGTTFHYVHRVLRLGQGDLLEAFDGSGTTYRIRISGALGATLTGRIEEELPGGDREPDVKVVLLQSVPKGSRMDRIVADATQLGVVRIVPVLSERVVPRWGEGNCGDRVKRWTRIARENSALSFRNIVPEIAQPLSFARALEIPADLVLLFYEGPGMPLRDALRTPVVARDSSVNVFIGPEGGYTDNEVSLAVRRGACVASLGRRVLRVETAAAAALALVIYEMDHMPARGGSRT